MLVPRAITWAIAQAELALSRGSALDESQQRLARAVGVGDAHRIRLAVVDPMPMPDDPLLRAAALQSGLLGPDMIGLTLGYAVLVRRGHESDTRLLRHEFRHVYQYERAGSIAAFLPNYLAEIVQFGYTYAPSEVDARNHEQG